MVVKTIEELSQIVEKQQKEIQILKDVHEIQNLMGRYIYYHEVNAEGNFPDKFFEMFYAKKTPGVSAEVAHGGVYLGEESIKKKMWAPMPGMDAGLMKGGLFTHPLTTPVIEVAGDGKTAKGVWISPGYETRHDPETKQPMGCFVYTKYGVDFVKENEKWKIWHYHVYRVFMTPWNVPFTEEWEKNVGDKQMPFAAGKRSDLPTTVDKPYSKDTARELVPAPPEPYETWSDTFSYGPPVFKQEDMK